METCQNPEILKVIMFVWKLIEIVRFVIPIGLLVMLTIDFMKNVIASKEDEMKKNVSIAIKRAIFCVVIFFIPTIVSLLNNILGDLGVDYAKCLTNANKEYIEKRTQEIAEDQVEKAETSKESQDITEEKTKKEKTKKGNTNTEELQ